MSSAATLNSKDVLWSKEQGKRSLGGVGKQEAEDESLLLLTWLWFAEVCFLWTLSQFIPLTPGLKLKVVSDRTQQHTIHCLCSIWTNSPGQLVQLSLSMLPGCFCFFQFVEDNRP